MAIREVAEIQEALVELEQRGMESLDLWEPLLGAQRNFYRSKARARVMMCANQVGKSTVCCVDYSMAFHGRHPRLPKQDGLAYLVAYDTNQIADVLFKKLFMPGAFEIIRDRQTGNWKTYKWWEEPDRQEEAIPAPPLIPERLIKGGWDGIAWENKKEGVPSVVKFVTGWELSFFSSKTWPPRGVQLDLAGLDEEIDNPEWYTELMARLIKRRGRLCWAVTPQVGTPRLYSLYEEALKLEGTPNPWVEFFYMEFDDNPYLRPEAREEFKAQIKDEYDYIARIKGRPVILGLRVLPEFEFRQEFMAIKPFDIPNSWTRYAYIDPGFQTAAVTFAAVPPPDIGNYVYVYDELYIKKCTARTLAEAMAQKLVTQELEDSIIDFQGARVRNAGDGKAIIEQYTAAFTRHGVQSRVSGTGFTHANADKKAGVEAIRELMRVREDDTTRLRYFPERCPNFKRELLHWNYKRDPKTKEPTNDPEDRGPVHQCANLRYMALHNPQYVKRETAKGSLAYRDFQRKWDARERLRGSHINLGPGDRLIRL